MHFSHVMELCLDGSTVTASMLVTPSHNPAITPYGSKCRISVMNLGNVLELVFDLAAVSTAVFASPRCDRAVTAYGRESSAGSGNVLHVH
mmetsp:Transcript_46065/g.103466  ORF Transcript_46065/g.103466 Transcript_46065/m.103466 type:complete len:90 (+) Transcript_46065:688-957(+)